MRLLDQLSKTRLGHGDHQLHLADARLAFVDGVLVVEQASLTHVTAGLQPEDTSIVFHRDHVLIDLWKTIRTTIRISATAHELAAAHGYFLAHGFAVQGAPGATVTPPLLS